MGFFSPTTRDSSFSLGPVGVWLALYQVLGLFLALIFEIFLAFLVVTCPVPSLLYPYGRILSHCQQVTWITAAAFYS